MQIHGLGCRNMIWEVCKGGLHTAVLRCRRRLVLLDEWLDI